MSEEKEKNIYSLIFWRNEYNKAVIGRDKQKSNEALTMIRHLEGKKEIVSKPHFINPL